MCRISGRNDCPAIARNHPKHVDLAAVSSERKYHASKTNEGKIVVWAFIDTDRRPAPANGSQIVVQDYRFQMRVEFPEFAEVLPGYIPIILEKMGLQETDKTVAKAKSVFFRTIVDKICRRQSLRQICRFDVLTFGKTFRRHLVYEIIVEEPRVDALFQRACFRQLIISRRGFMSH